MGGQAPPPPYDYTIDLKSLIPTNLHQNIFSSHRERLRVVNLLPRYQRERTVRLDVYFRQAAPPMEGLIFTSFVDIFYGLKAPLC